MPNTDIDRLRFKRALAAIVGKYGDWINDNRHLKNLIAATDQRFDQIIFFESPPDFRVQMMRSGFQTNEGCSVAAMTLSRRDDDALPDYQRKIYFNRSMVTEHTIVHEIFHFLAHPAFGRELKPKVVEGFTEYFTHKVIGSPGSAAAAAAATGDDAVQHQSAYVDYTRNVQTTRDFLRNVVFATIKQDRAINLGPTVKGAGFMGHQRNAGFQPPINDYPGVNFKNFTKRAYFKGDPLMIRFIKDQSGW